MYKYACKFFFFFNKIWITNSQKAFIEVDVTVKALEHLAPVCYFPVSFFLKTACCPLILLRHLHQPTSFVLRGPCRIQGHVDKIKIEVMWFKLFFTTSPKTHRHIFIQTLGSDFQRAQLSCKFYISISWTFSQR